MESPSLTINYQPTFTTPNEMSAFDLFSIVLVNRILNNGIFAQHHDSGMIRYITSEEESTISSLILNKVMKNGAYCKIS